jgi:hypothetical protein
MANPIKSYPKNNKTKPKKKIKNKKNKLKKGEKKP